MDILMPLGQQDVAQVQFNGTKPQFNGTKCPAYWELQTSHMSQDFHVKMLEGYYYELAFHDATQFPLCPNKVPRCITSDKAVEAYSDGQRYVNDTWDLQCFGVEYPQTLLFNETDKPGFLKGYVPATKIPLLPPNIVSALVFPNTIVDFKAGPQGYSLEMQCVEFLGRIAFVGINYYTKEKTEEAFQQIDKVARAQGLGYFLDKNTGVRRVNHTGCPNEPKVSSQTAVLV